jgi:phosphoserine phosphatase RsbU/P
MVESGVLERIRDGLLVKRHTLAEWLQATPAQQRQARLGPLGDAAVQGEIRSIDGALVKADCGTLGTCQVCCERVETRLLEMDYTACVCLDHLTELEQRQLESELELSQEVQRALLPQQPPDIPGVEISAFSRPAQILGGDMFDFLQYRDGAPAIVIGDVAGHGVSAGLLMASVQAALRTVIPESTSPDEALGRINRFFSHNIRFTTFVTLFLARPDLDNRILFYSNAGHNPPLLYSAKHAGAGGIAWLRPTGAAIGLVEDFRPGLASLQLTPGDVLLLYTDGITEALDDQGQPFGEDGLAGVMQQSSGLTASEIAQRLWSALQDHIGSAPLADDATLVAARVVM